MQQNNFPFILSIEDITQLFGALPSEVEASCGKQLSTMDLRYRTIDGVGRDNLILCILKRIEDTELPVSGEDRQPDWDAGWGENLKDFVESGYDVEKLVPKYFKKNVPVRLLGGYVLPSDPNFVLNCTRLFRAWLFQKYLPDYSTLYEFGCGPATHLAYLAETFPDKKLVGLDWARPSQEIIRLLAQHRGWNVEGHNFDFFKPDPKIHIDTNSAVYTFGALEQIGNKHEKFLQFLLREKPGICINIECISEFYDESKLTDYLALCYHKRKNYLDGYLTQLRTLEVEGKIELIAEHHQQFGNVYDDSHSYVVWKPL